ncbi:MAG: YncE family protein [Dysgonamonadaceae bacterium]|jgi:hypothetical protein|nr:YncE family protein [Dysgonamonadaceae bacterium]
MKEQVLYFLLLLVLFAACRGEIPLIQEEEENVSPPSGDKTVAGFYLLNEGNMGSNKASLDYFDSSKGQYHRNIYAERNPSIVKELGDVGNDIAVYGSKLYAVINCSNYVEVMDARTAKHIGSFEVQNCRYITFGKGKAYVSSYAGPVQIDPNARPGKVVEVDTVNFQIQREVTVGYQPEEMVITDGKLYVANSGGYRVPNYDKTISVIDLASFTETKKINVAINLHRMRLDNYGNIYVTSRGDYYDVHSNVYVINSKTDLVTSVLDFPANELWVHGDSLYAYSSEFSKYTNEYTVNYTIYDVKKRKVMTKNFITDGSDKEIDIPYALAVHPVTSEIFVSDAKDYVTPGRLYCFSPDGKQKWTVTTGDIPAHIVFLMNK